MLGYYNYTVILTYVGMLSSFVGIIYAIDGRVLAALVALMISGICDMFDGRIASTMKRNRAEKLFGIQIDSLCDLICFCTLPAILVHMMNPGSAFASFVCGLYLLCGLIRLSYFNVDETIRQEGTDDGRKIYKGLPVTSAAIVLPLLYDISKYAKFDPSTMMAIALLVMAIAFLTPFEIKKPHKLGKAVFAVAGLAVLILLVI